MTDCLRITPQLRITMEAAYKCFGLTLEFGQNCPDTVVFHAYYNGALQEDYMVSGLTQTYVVSHEFPEFDFLELEFVRGCPNNRVILDSITFGDSTDYILEYGVELTKTPKGTQLDQSQGTAGGTHHIQSQYRGHKGACEGDHNSDRPG